MPDLLTRIRRWQSPAPWAPEPFVVLIRKPRFDAEGTQRAKRINGSVECPKCGLYWPMVEDIGEWTQGDDGRWHSRGWNHGFAECLICGLVFADTFEGVICLGGN